MKYILLSISFLLAATFVTLECIVLLFDVKNESSAYYYGALAVASVILLVISRSQREKDKRLTAKASYNIHVILQIITVFILVVGLLVLATNYFMSEM